jgi:RNA polymerase sigma factor (sigma-70 family)
MQTAYLNIDNYTLQTLVKGAKEGLLPAQEALYMHFCKAMYNVCTRMCSNEYDANDMLQEGFITAFGKIHQLKEAEQFGGWLKRIIINQCIAYSKRKIVFAQLPATELEIVHGTHETWWHTISMPQIHEAIKLLPDGCRQVFVLYAVENYTHKQIAAELQISEGTSKSQYSRAKQLLQQSILKKMVANG